MTPDPIRGSIRIAGTPETGLRPGQSVSVNVIKHLEGAKWAVAIKGRVFPAFSELPLQAGQLLRARVSAAEGRLLLTVTEEVPDAVRAALVRQGLPAGGDAEVIAHALARSGLPILAETIQKVLALLTRSGMDLRKAARIAATMVDRGIDPAGPGARALLPVLGFGERGGEDHRRYRGRQLPDTPRAVKEFAAALSTDPAARPSVLQAYNHIRAKSQSWVVIPFVFTSGSQRIAGTMKILFDPFQSKPLAFTLSTEDISFHLPLRARQGRLAIYCDDERLRRAAQRGLDSLRSKFHNMGLEVDDIINKGEGFDGFSPGEEGMILPSVDTVG
ncbi:MAG: hypothetical protein ABSB63_09170 [Spirochaetia bacterium]